MQFLLTEEERENLVPLHNLVALRTALTYCLQLIEPTWCPYHGDPVNCCDECPLETLNQDKHPGHPGRDIVELICDRGKVYGK